MSNIYIKEKFTAFIFPIFSLIILFSGLAFIKNILNIENDLIWELPFYTSVIICLILFFLNNFMPFMKLWVWFTALVMIASVLSMTVFLVIVALSIQTNINIVIYTFLSIFYLAVTYDIFIIYKQQHNIDIDSTIYGILQKNTEISFTDFMQIISKETHNPENKNITYKLFMLFSLPFVLLGKGSAYFLALSTGEYFDSKEYIVAVIGFVLILFLFMASFSVFYSIINFKTLDSDNKPDV